MESSGEAAAVDAPKRGPAARIQAALQQGWLRFLVKVFPPSTAEVVLTYLLYAYLLAFISKWAAVWLGLALLAPDWLLPGDSAVGTLAQVLPALMVSIFVFLLGAFFVVNQQATAIHSNRASLLLLHDTNIQRAVARPLVISVATLLMALLASGDAGNAVAALAVVLVLATGFTLVSAATLLPTLMIRVTAPRNFALYTLEGVDVLLSEGITGLVVYRVGLLGEMLKRGVRSGDSLQIFHALAGLEGLHKIYLEAAAENPSARIHAYDNNTATGWIAEEMVGALVSAGQEAIGGDIANDDGNRICSTLSRFGTRSAEAGHLEEYERAVDGLGELGTCTQQAKVPGVVNVFSETIFSLGRQVPVATEHLGRDQGGQALAVWALVMAYEVQHLGVGDPVHRNRCLEMWDVDGPWEEAHQYIESEDFQRKWANKLPSIKPVPFTPEDDGATEEAEETMLPGGAMAVHLYLANAEMLLRGAS